MPSNGSRQHRAAGLRRWLITRAAVVRLGILAAVVAALGTWSLWAMIRMPGRSYRGELPALTEEQAALSEALRRDVVKLAAEIGERNVFREQNMAAAADFIEASLADAGYEVTRLPFDVNGTTCVNLAGELAGGARAGEIVVVGSHYDSLYGTVGANDNATGVAATLALARRLAGLAPARTVRFAFFTNEEPPFFRSARMGSRVYAEGCRERGERIVAMLSLETIGYYRDDEGSQRYPFPFGLLYPSTGDFIGFVGNYGSRRLVRQVVKSFRRHARFPSEGGAIPSFVPGVGWSDHWAFWREGYPALMVTDTAPFRYPHYHTPRDTPDKLDYDRMARVVSGLVGVVEDLAGAEK